MLSNDQDHGRTIALNTLETIVHALGFDPKQVLNVWMDADYVRVEHITSDRRKITEEFRVIRPLK